MKTVGNVQELREKLAQSRSSGSRIGFVPTMGNLHDGHISLFRTARGHAQTLVASIFVNPFQFARGEDLSTYPRTLAADSVKLAAAGVDILFLPDVDTIYPQGADAITRIEVPGLGSELCGAVRPDFFRGVCTVVAVLLNIVMPDAAIFGEKDYQQLVIVKKMVRDLHLLTDIVGSPTVRESDGLAMSSRNTYLEGEWRAMAPGLYTALKATADQVQTGKRAFDSLEAAAMGSLRELGFNPDYVSIRNAVDLSQPGDGEQDLIVLGAASLGRARLIDNVRVGPFEWGEGE